MKPSGFQRQAQDRFMMDMPSKVRELLEQRTNQTACFIDERQGIGGGVEFRIITRATGECIGAIRVERS